MTPLDEETVFGVLDAEPEPSSSAFRFGGIPLEERNVCVEVDAAAFSPVMEARSWLICRVRQTWSDRAFQASHRDGQAGISWVWV